MDNNRIRKIAKYKYPVEKRSIGWSKNKMEVRHRGRILKRNRQMPTLEERLRLFSHEENTSVVDSMYSIS